MACFFFLFWSDWARVERRLRIWLGADRSPTPSSTAATAATAAVAAAAAAAPSWIFNVLIYFFYRYVRYQQPVATGSSSTAYIYLSEYFFLPQNKKKRNPHKAKKTLPTWTNKSYQDSISNRTWLVITNSSWSTPWAAHSTREPLTIDPTLPIKIFLHEEERKKTLFIDWEPIFHSASRWCWVVHWRHLIYARSKAPHDEIMQENHGMEVEK